MYRLFDTHNIRKTKELTGLWDFATRDGSYVGKLAVPSCLEVIPSLAAYKGEATYSRTLSFGGNARLVFKGVSHTARVFCDGVQVGEHYNAYTPFSVDLSCPHGEHKIEVVVDNSYSDESALHVENDYYTYGGIIRPIIFEELSEAVINAIHFTPYLSGGVWRSGIRIFVESKSCETRDYTLCLKLSGDVICEIPFALGAGKSTVLDYDGEFEGAMAYELDSPKMYMLSAEIISEGALVDDLIERVGFREIKTSGKKILYNGKPIRILGFNRHEDYNSFGSSIPLQAIMRDIALIRETGANAIRTSHYPNDELFLDVCDELGILVWEEAHARGLGEARMRNPRFIPQSIRCIDEMIFNHYNHPTIFCWGILNECVSDTEFGRECYRTLFDEIEKNDTSRPVTFASNRHYRDICFDLVDVISSNIYPLWYDGYDGRTVAETLDALKQYADSTGNGNKPLIISEIGAGGIYGYRSDTSAKWTEERQAKILDEQLTAVLADEDTSGVFIWQFCDVRVDESWFASRPRCENNKGIVDEYRRKKLAYDVVKRHFTADKLRRI